MKDFNKELPTISGSCRPALDPVDPVWDSGLIRSASDTFVPVGQKVQTPAAQRARARRARLYVACCHTNEALPASHTGSDGPSGEDALAVIGGDRHDGYTVYTARSQSYRLKYVLDIDVHASFIRQSIGTCADTKTNDLDTPC